MTPVDFFFRRSIINNVLNVFRPKRWVLTMVADKAGLSTITENPFNVEQVSKTRGLDEVCVRRDGGRFSDKENLNTATIVEVAKQSCRLSLHTCFSL